MTRTPGRNFFSRIREESAKVEGYRGVMGTMRKVGWFTGAATAALATGLVLGCAQRPTNGEAKPCKTPAAVVSAPTVALERDTSLRVLEWRLAREAKQRGLGKTVAFVWGDVTPLPGAIPVHITTEHKTLDGWLVGGAHELDVGKLAPDIENISLVQVDDRGLFASHPSAPGRQQIDLDGPHDSESRHQARVVFAMVDGDSGHDVRADDAVAWLGKLSGWVRYGVLALPDA
jgi:hypothetical protein